MQPCSRPVTGEETRGKKTPRKQKGNVRLSICLGFSSISQVSSQVGCRARLCPPSPRERAWTGTCITHERVQDRGLVFFLGGCGCGRRRIRVPMLLGDLILARINIVVPKEVTGATKAQHDK